MTEGTILGGLRQEVSALLGELPLKRRPALRRALTDDALLSTDLPRLADASALARFTRCLTDAGWSCREENGWLLLDKPVRPDPVSLPAEASGEAGCCVSILSRHQSELRPDAVWTRRLLKAQEQNAPVPEDTCRALHAELSARLRRHEALPDVLTLLCVIFS